MRSDRAGGAGEAADPGEPGRRGPRALFLIGASVAAIAGASLLYLAPARAVPAARPAAGPVGSSARPIATSGAPAPWGSEPSPFLVGPALGAPPRYYPSTGRFAPGDDSSSWVWVRAQPGDVPRWAVTGPGGVVRLADGSLLILVSPSPGPSPGP